MLASEHDVEALTSSAAVAQAWRDPSRQARLARALSGFSEQPLDAACARRCGLLLARAGSSDIVDAAVALAASHGDTVLTSDPSDIQRLLDVAGTAAQVRAV